MLPSSDKYDDNVRTGEATLLSAWFKMNNMKLDINDKQQQRRFSVAIFVGLLALLFVAQVCQGMNPSATGGGALELHKEDDHRRQLEVLMLDPSSASLREKRMKKPKDTIAYMITVTSCSSTKHSSWGFKDTAAVLAHSIHLNSFRNDGKSNYDYKLYAAVHSSAPHCAKYFPELNYTVLYKDTPINMSQIPSKHYRDRIRKNGCCGEREFLKLYALLLRQHSIVVALDADCLLLKPLDPLFDAMLLPDDAEKDLGKHVQWPSLHGKLRRRIHAYLTHDYHDHRLEKADYYGVQGGFWIVRPNQTAFDELVALVHAGNFSWGWFDADVKYPGYYGAPQIQGLLSWYYGRQRPNQHVELHSCLYNNMAQWPLDDNNKCYLPGVTRENCPNCQQTPIEEIYTLHYTACGKPWSCMVRDEHTEGHQTRPYVQRCNELSPLWFAYRHSLETTGLHLPSPLLPNSSHLDRHFSGYCRPSYIPMNFSKIFTAANNVSAHV